MKYKLVIFDCDGTLIDTATDVIACFNEALEACGFSRRSYRTVASLLGGSLEEIVAGLLDGSCDLVEKTDIQRVATAYKRCYANSEKTNTVPFSGMVDLVDELLAAGAHVAVNSNKPESALKSIVAECFPNREIEIIGHSGVYPAKPHPDGALELVRRCGIKRSFTVYVGDTLIDYETARRADMDFIMTTWGQGDYDAFREHSSMTLCDSSSDLKDLLMD